MVSQRLGDFSVLQLSGDALAFMEKRIENDGSGNPIYVGYNKEANADVDEETWFIVKISYTDGYPVRYQLPFTGSVFEYAWSNRANIFA